MAYQQTVGLATLALLLSLSAFMVLVLPHAPWTAAAELAFLGSPTLAATGIILGHFARSRSKAAAGNARSRRIAVVAIVTGYAWFAEVFILSSPRFSFEIGACVAMIEVWRVLVREVKRRYWPSVGLVLAAGALASVLLDSEFEPACWFGLVGVVALCLLPGWVCFAPNPELTPKRRIFLVGLIYVLAAADVWAAWDRYQIYQMQQKGHRARWAKVGIRNLAFNLETYYIDHSTYPPAVDENGRVVPFTGEGTPVSAGYVPWMLTTPVAYAAGLSADPYHRRADGTPLTFRYATNGSACWVMTSLGPDEDADIHIEDFPDAAKANCDWRQFMSHFGTGSAIEYDASNGTLSSGDIIRVGP